MQRCCCCCYTSLVVKHIDVLGNLTKLICKHLVVVVRCHHIIISVCIYMRWMIYRYALPIRWCKIWCPRYLIDGCSRAASCRVYIYEMYACVVVDVYNKCRMVRTILLWLPLNMRRSGMVLMSERRWWWFVATKLCLQQQAVASSSLLWAIAQT